MKLLVWLFAQAQDFEKQCTNKQREDTENLPTPNILAAEIVEQLEAALEEFKSVEDILG